MIVSFSQVSTILKKDGCLILKIYLILRHPQQPSYPSPPNPAKFLQIAVAFFICLLGKMEQHDPYANVNIGPPALKKIQAAIRKLWTHKAPGIDSIPAGSLQRFHDLFNAIWTQELFSQKKLDSVTIPVFKKSERTECKNYRRIYLTDITAKIFANILLIPFRSIKKKLNKRT